MGEFEGFIGVDLWTALFTLLNTLTVIFVGTKFLFKPVMKMIASRQKEIDDMYDAAGQAEADARAMREDYQKKIAEAHQTSERIVKEAVARGQKREDEIIAQAQQQASQMMHKAESDIAQEKKKALNDAKNEISDIALAIAGKVVARELTSADQADLVDSFIDRLGE